MKKYINILIYQNNSTKFYPGVYNLNKHEFWTQLNYQTYIMSLVVNVKSSHTERLIVSIIVIPLILISVSFLRECYHGVVIHERNIVSCVCVL